MSAEVLKNNTEICHRFPSCFCKPQLISNFRINVICNNYKLLIPIPEKYPPLTITWIIKESIKRLNILNKNKIKFLDEKAMAFTAVGHACLFPNDSIEDVLDSGNTIIIETSFIQQQQKVPITQQHKRKKDTSFSSSPDKKKATTLTKRKTSSLTLKKNNNKNRNKTILVKDNGKEVSRIWNVPIKLKEQQQQEPEMRLIDGKRYLYSPTMHYKIQNEKHINEILQILGGYEYEDGMWCRYCGCRCVSSWGRGPWGNRKLCMPHYEQWRKGTLSFGKYETKEPDTPLDTTKSTELSYLGYLVRQEVRMFQGTANDQIKGNTISRKRRASVLSFPSRKKRKEKSKNIFNL